MMVVVMDILIGLAAYRLVGDVNELVEKEDYKLYLLGILLMARNGLSTLIVLIADRFIFSTLRQYSNAPARTMKRSSLFQESARYDPLP